MLVGAALALVVSWLVLFGLIWLGRPDERSAREGVRLLPDVLRLVRRLASDPSSARGTRVRLFLLLAYLTFPVDLVPDFIPVIGYADDVVIVAAVLRSIVRTSGSRAIRLHWPGTEEGLTTLWRVARLPGTP